jgi:uncharacterized protein (DUF433 family)
VNVQKDTNAKKFDRIVSYPDSPDGLAYIRDTGILASEVAARMADANQSRDEILRDYPMLDDEDIQQALVYALQEQASLFRVISFELRPTVAMVRGAASLLDDPEITAEVRSQLLRFIAETADKWSSTLDGVSLSQRALFGRSADKLFALNLQEFVAHYLPQPQATTHSTENVNLEISISNELPLIKGHVLLFDTLKALLDGSVIYNTRGNAALHITQLSPTLVEVTIIHNVNSFPDMSAADLLWRNPTFSAVVRVIQLSGSELKIIPAADHVKFMFQLPVWSENEPV